LSGPEVKIDRFKVKRERITVVTRQLSLITGVPVCSEEARWFPGVSDTQSEVDRLKKRRKRGLTLKAQGKTLAETLDALVSDDTRYAWRYDRDKSLVNLYPRENAPLDWQVERVELSERSYREIFVEGDLLGLSRHDIEFDPGRGRLSWLDTRVSVNMSHTVMRNVVNYLCSRLPFKAGWSLFEIGGEVPSRVIRMLMFFPC
jgi:hypothetical protein